MYCKIPADSFVVEAAELTSDESAMTGETDPIKKDILAHCIEKRNLLISEGTKVMSRFTIVEYCWKT